MTTFLRLLEAEPDRKGSTLADAARRWRSGSEPEGIFEVEPSSFEQVPGSPFAYWVSERVRRLFTELPAFEGEGRTVKVGLQTSDDFRFVRCWWEVDAAKLSKKWFPFAKGGAYSPFYADVHMVVNWEEGGREIKRLICQEYPYLNNNPDWVAKNTDFYFRPGLTWSERTAWFSLTPLPSGSIFSVSGKAAFAEDPLVVQAIAGTTAANFLMRVYMARSDLDPKYQAGDLQRLPFPDSIVDKSRTCEVIANLTQLNRDLFKFDETSLAFVHPAVAARSSSKTLMQGCEAAQQIIREHWIAMGAGQRLLDDIAIESYGLAADRAQIEASVINPLWEQASDDSYGLEADAGGLVAFVEALLEWTLGAALGRFDVRLGAGEREPRPDPDPFDPLPVSSPGMLQDESGLPTRGAPAGYPLDLPPHGILVDDPGHPWDVVARTEAVVDLVAGDRGHAWIQEAEAILGRDLRDWLRRYGFERHLKRYSRSRRKAPLFWHLAPKSREYGVWLYSPVATRDTFYRIQNDYVDPKLKAAERRLLELRQHAGASPTGQQRKDLTSQESLVEELRAFREQVALVAPLWKPFRDDGVVLNCALLSRLFDHHRAWQKECAKKWDELAGGKYDWAGWAMHLWPERVVATCASDRSIAIAHGMEEALWREEEDGKWKPAPDAEMEAARLVTERRSPAVEATLDAYERAG